MVIGFFFLRHSVILKKEITLIGTFFNHYRYKTRNSNDLERGTDIQKIP